LELLCETLDEVLAGREDVYVSGNMAVYYSALQAKKNDFKAPDVFVVLDAQGRHERKSWVLWEEDLRTPNLVVELLSPTTEDNDRGPKKLIYERLLRVPNYFLYDPLDFRFEGFRLVDGEYVPMTPDADGRLPWREGGVVLGRWTGSYRGRMSTWLRPMDAKGLVIPTAAERAEAEAQRAEAEAQRAKAEARRAEAEAQRAEAAEARVQALLDELAALKRG
jgi:hypothetical protein